MTPARRVCLLVALAFAAACGGAERPRPDIWLVVLDTTRADHLGVYGHRRPTTPFLDRLARSAAVFEDAWSASTNTAPATASLFTSQYPRDHGVTLGFYGHQRQVDDLARRGAAEMEINQLPSKTPTLPEVLANAGYRTFGLASNINIGSEIGFSRGFDRFERHPLADADALEQRLMPWQDEIEGGRTPFFLYLHLNDAHQPYTPRAPWRQAWRGPDETKLGSPAAYDSEIRFTDEMLGRVYERIGRLREALVVVASDHGEEFFDHGSTGHGLSLHRELQRMVLLVRPGGGLPEAARIDTPVSIIDVLPTVADFAGISADPRWLGHSLRPLIESTGAPADAFSKRELYAQKGRPGSKEIYSIVRGKWKHIWQPGHSRVLYDRERDPLEETSLYQPDVEPGASLHAALVAYRDAIPEDRGEVVDVPLDAEGLEQLRQLGYTERDGPDGQTPEKP